MEALLYFQPISRCVSLTMRDEGIVTM